MKRLTVDLSEESHRKLKIHCATEGLDMAEVVRQLIDGYLVTAKTEKKPPKKQA